LTEILIVRVIRSITDMPGETINRFAPNFSEAADCSDRFAILGIEALSNCGVVRSDRFARERLETRWKTPSRRCK
jgi:hypothetical protein